VPKPAGNWAGFSSPVDIHLYVLALEGGHFYVGLTADVEQRRRQHFEGAGAEWTRLHRPTAVLRSIATGTQNEREALAIEDEVTVTLMAQHGIDRVRGGRFCHASPADVEAALISRGHWHKVTDVVQAMCDATRGLNDFAGAIRERRPDSSARTRFTPQDAAREHALSRAWLQERLDAPTDPAVSATVVVTHHAPSSLSMDPIYEGSELNPCFYSDLPESFFQCAALWIHGHSHSSADYQHHRTRVIANPRGYARRNGTVENEHFDPGLVVTLESGADHG